MTEKRINKAIQILDYAINNKISVTESCTQNGVAKTYVKNVKMICKEDYNDGVMDDGLFNRFMEKYGEYEIMKANGLKVTTNNDSDEGVKVSSDIKLGSQSKLIGSQTSVKMEGNSGEINFKGSGDSFDEAFKGDKVDDENTGTEFHLGYPKDHVSTLDQLLDRCDVDRDLWDVENYLVNKWDVTSWKHGEPQTWENFQVKAKLKLKEAQAKAKSAGEIFKQMVETYQPPILDVNFKKSVSSDEGENNVLEVALFDLHYGKLAWNGETGEDYDTKIARKRFIYAIKKLVQRSSGFPIKKVLFPIGNDFFNSDTIANTTTNGTPQDEDLRWQKTFESGCELIVDGINILKQLGVPVEVLVIPGNHDFERSFYLGSFISAWFRNDKQVDVDNRAMPRKYFRWGKVLLGFTHGRDEKENSLPMLMARDVESKKHWSETDFHEWHLGHFHRKKTKKFTILDKTDYVDEEEGVIVRYLSSLTGTEEWHFRKGFVGQIKAGEAFIINDKLGMIGHFNANYIFEGPVEENNDVNKLLKM